jgi:O-antigen ligase
MNFNLDKVYQYLLIALAFVFPLTVVGGNLIIGIIVLLWMLSGNYQAKFNQIISNKLAIFSILFFSTHVVGLLWTENMEWGLLIVNKMWYFLLLLPILLTITKKEYISHYISAFILAMTLTELLSYLVWFEVIGPLHKATAGNPTPTMSHISYNPFLVFGIYLSSHRALFNKNLTKLSKYIYVIFVVTMSINMFITGGRAGQVMYFVMLSILIFQYYGSDQKIRSIIALFIITPSVILGAYNFSDIFHKRVNDAVSDVRFHSAGIDSNTSVGQRMTYITNTLEIIKKNPFFGVGTGDFPSEYSKINVKNTPSMNPTTNPHNMYILITAQLGLFGLLGMLLIFYQQIKFSLSEKIKINKDLGIVLPLLFLVAMFSDSYLLGHYTTLLFVFFSSFLYKKF